MSKASTIPKIYLHDVPSSPLMPLMIEQQDEIVSGLGFIVMFNGDKIGTINAQIASQNKTLRWFDVDTDNKRKREPDLKSHEKSLMLLDKCCYTIEKKPHYFEDPFPHGCDTIEEMTMIGGEEFKKTFSLYNHWFRQVSPIERLTREIRNFDASKLSLEELKIVEKELKKTWAESHQILMKRAVGQ